MSNVIQRNGIKYRTQPSTYLCDGCVAQPPGNLELCHSLPECATPNIHDIIFVAIIPRKRTSNN